MIRRIASAFLLVTMILLVGRNAHAQVSAPSRQADILYSISWC